VGRPSRKWAKKTYTVSPLVETYIREKAYEWGLDPGTALDVLIWENELLDHGMKPSKNYSDEYLVRHFSEEVLLEVCPRMLRVRPTSIYTYLSRELKLPEGEEHTVREIDKVLNRWNKTRHVEAKYRDVLFKWLWTTSNSWKPTIYRLKVVTRDWFSNNDSSAASTPIP